MQSQWKGASQKLPTSSRQEETGDDDEEGGHNDEVHLASQVYSRSVSSLIEARRQIKDVAEGMPTCTY